MFKKFMAFLMIAVFATGNLGVQVFAADSDWTELASMPIANGSPTLAEHNGKIYSIGGSGLIGGVSGGLNTLHIYDIASNTWSTGANLPSGINSLNVEIINNKIYVIGGKGSTGTSDAVYIYDIASNTWSNGAKMPQAIVYSISAPVNDDIYIIGGSNSSPLNTVYKYNTTSDTWHTVATLPISFFASGSTPVLLGNNIYIFGGFGIIPPDPSTQTLNTVYKFNLTTNELTLYDELPFTIITPSVNMFDDYVYISGGILNATGYSNKFYKYDLISKSIVEEVNFPSIINGSDASIIVDNMFYLIGGFEKSSTVTNKAYSYELKPTPTTPAIHLLMRKGGTKSLLSLSQNLSLNTTYTWSSDNPAVATVDANGLVTAVDIGTAKIYAESLDGTFKESIAVKVIDEEVPGGSIVLAIDITIGNNEELYLSDSSGIVWSSLNPSIASVDATGKVTALSKGLAVIEASEGGISHYVNVRVR